MSTISLRLELIAPVPVGHHVTIHPIEELSGKDQWIRDDAMAVVCDDVTKVVYTGRFVASGPQRPGAVRIDGTGKRLGKPITGTVISCTVLTDHGDGIRMETHFEIQLDAATYRG
ncbi:MAG: hypothetical protein ACXWP4_10690 [Polyangiales bacterium]